MSLLWKVCGITNAEDAGHAVAAGADALGFVMWPDSPRAIAPEDAARITAGESEDIWRVGVFVDASDDEMRQAIRIARLDFVQLHGDEPPALCGAVPRPVFKALRLAPGTTVKQAEELAEPYTGFILLIDARVEGLYGGTGEATDWEVAAALSTQHQVVLAGGLRADNVAAAVERVDPWAVDVSSGVEAAPGRKDPDKLAAFARALEPYR